MGRRGLSCLGLDLGRPKLWTNQFLLTCVMDNSVKVSIFLEGQNYCGASRRRRPLKSSVSR